MATAGQFKSRIDQLKKKIAEKGPALPPERRRQLSKRLKRLQRSRRVAAALETRGKPKPAAPPAEAKPAGGEAAPPA